MNCGGYTMEYSPIGYDCDTKTRGGKEERFVGTLIKDANEMVLFSAGSYELYFPKKDIIELPEVGGLQFLAIGKQYRLHFNRHLTHLELLKIEKI